MIRTALTRLAQRLLSGPHREFVLGDLEDGFERLAKSRNVVIAALWFVMMTLRSAVAMRRRGDTHTRAIVTRAALEGLIGDLRLGVRLFARQPGIAVTVTVVMTLGIAVATFAFGVHYGMFQRGLPVGQPDRIVDLSSTIPERGVVDMGLSIDDYLDIREQQTTMDHVAVWGRTDVNLSYGEAPPERIPARIATASFYRILEISPLLGRLPTEREAMDATAMVVVLSHSLWHETFGDDPRVLGRIVRVDGEAATVVAVLPPGAGFPAAERQLIYLPARTGAATNERRGARTWWGLGRLTESTSLENANQELDLLMMGLATAYPETNEGVGARVIPVVEGQMGQRSTYTLLTATGALMLLIAIGNVTNLFLVHSLSRDRELRVRLALGATRWRVIRHFVGAAALPVAMGAVAGAFLAATALRWYGSRPLATWEAYRLEGPHIAFVSVVMCTTLVIISAAAGGATLRRGNHLPLSGGTRNRARRQFSRVGYGLVVGEIALGGALLFVAGLMVKTAINLQTVDYGFAIDNVVTGRIQVDAARYSTPQARLAFWDTFLARAKTIPGVENVSLSTQLPMIRYRAWSLFRLEGAPPPLPGEFPGANRSAVSPGFFDTFEKSVLRGRVFTEADGRDAEPVVIVNEDFVRKFFADGRALGRRIKLGGPESTLPWMRVVGIAPHMWMDTDVDAFPEGLYVPLAQHDPLSASIAMRVVGPPQHYVAPLREALRAIDAELPLGDAMTMAEVIHMRTTMYRQTGPQYVFLGAVSLVLSIVGLYGVMAYVARARTQEIGIRIALGAQRANVLRLVLRLGALQIVAGIVLGVAVALSMSRGLSRLVFQMTPWDPWVLVSSFALLAGVGMLATLIPARRAMRVDPLVALRADQ